MKPSETHRTDGLVTQAMWLTVAKIIGVAMSLVVPLVLVRRLNQSEFGLYKQAFQILTTLVSLLGLQMSASVYYFMPREPRKKPQVAMNVLLFYGVLGSVVALAFALCPGWIRIIFRSDDLIPSVPILGLAILLWLVSSGLEGFMLANGEARLASVFVVIIQLAKAILLILAAVLFGSIRAVVLAAVIQGALQCVILLTYLYFRLGQFWRPFDGSLLKAQLANSLPFGLGGLAWVAQNDLHNYFVSHYFAPAEFAIYAVGCFQLPMLTALFDAVEGIVCREAARLQKEGVYKRLINVWMNALRGLAFCFVPVCFFLFVVKRELIIALFTPVYASAVPIFAVNLLNLLLWGPHAAIVRAFSDLRFFRLKLYLVLFPLSWAALYFGIHVAGLIGAIASTVLMRFLDVAVTSMVLGRRLGVGRADLEPLLHIAKIVAAAAVAAAMTFAVKLMLGTAPLIVMLGICCSVFGLVYLIVAFAAGAASAEEKSKIRDLLRRLYRTGSLRIGLSPETEIW